MIDTLLFHVRCFGLFHRYLWSHEVVLTILGRTTRTPSFRFCARCGVGAPRW